MPVHAHPGFAHGRSSKMVHKWDHVESLNLDVKSEQRKTVQPTTYEMTLGKLRDEQIAFVREQG